jgi:enterobacterial common antigen flippase
MNAGVSSREPSSTGTVPSSKEAATVTHGYRQILKSSALVGGSQVLSILIGIVRTKAMAVLLGPSAFGLFGLYGSICDLTQSIAGLGVNSSGVRQIAEAAASGNSERIGETVAVLRRTSLVLGVLGAGLLVVFAGAVSRLTFGNAGHAGAISLLSAAVFLRLVSAGQGALIQGMRRISDLARMSVIGAFFGVIVGVPAVYFFGEQGIVPSLIGVAAMMIFSSWWYSRKIRIQLPTLTVPQVARQATPLLKLGFAFMGTGLMTMGCAYVIRVIVLRELGFEATGLYQSAWTLGGLYVSFILQAMGADFYPRLTASANDNEACNQMVNEQTRVGLLLAGPGAIATLTFAPLIISSFYTARFSAAVGILRWICLGTTLQVLTWPMGFISLAKCRSSVFFWSDFAWAATYLSLTSACVKWFGLNGTGIAFFGSYVFHALITYPIARRLSGFRWSIENTRASLVLLPLIAIVFCGFYVLPRYGAVFLGFSTAGLAGIYSLRALIAISKAPSVSPRFAAKADSSAT